ncbi:MAG TPA: class I SAM-dependent RNA methyltransferase [Blastocatellia bacterium]|nr:class I SAM-dependent RNA methyltransferase [Blastocatellia bacterium]
MQERGPSTGDIIEVTTERMAYGGDAVARYNGLTVFVPLAAPGERLRVRITERKKRFARAAILDIVTPSPSRRNPPCSYFGDCGGCQLQHLSYEAQLEAKVGFIRDALARIARVEWPHAIRVRHAAEFQYRARARFKLEEQAAGQGGLRIGFNRAGSHAVCDVAHCPVLTPELNSALMRLRSGLKREKSVRETRLPAEIEVAAGESGVAIEPEIAGIGGREIERVVRGAVYRFSGSAFFQVNRFLLADLIDEALDGASGKLAIDLYAGVALFTVQLARSFDMVIGVESEPETSRFARLNLKANGVTNVEFHNKRVEIWLERFAESFPGRGHGSIDLILLDPPRSGASEAIAPIAALRPERIVYVACDPVTMARDLGKLLDSGYEFHNVSALDLFPQTYHIETVVSLGRSNSSG